MPLKRLSIARLSLALCTLAALAFVLAAPAAPGGRAAAAATPPSVDWPSYNNDLASDRYVDLAQITTANVGELHVACTVPIGAPQSLESGPIEIAGTIYITESRTTLAINATTCRTLWTNTYAPARVWNNRGAAYANGVLFRGYGDGHVVAINATTGLRLWNQTVIAAGSLEAITAAPIVWHGMVFIGTANGEGGQLCHVMALDAVTGKVLWTLQTVPNPGTTEATQTWAGAVHIAGGATWSSLSLDAAGNTLYVPVGNPAPDYDTRKRLGLNLATNAVLEINPQTGFLRHALQFEPEDAHDWDQAAAPAVVQLGSGEKIVLAAGKDGLLRSVDVATNAQRWETPITTIANAAAPIATTGTHFCPSGAVFWNGPAYSPATGLTYVNAADWCRTVYREATPAPFVPGQDWLGSSRVVPDAAKSGWLRAVNATTGATRWTYHASAPLIAGVTPTAGGLVFTGDLLGNVLAFDAADGTLLKSIPTGLPIGGGVISYEVNGTQYVAVAAGLSSGEFGTPTVTPALVILSR